MLREKKICQFTNLRRLLDVQEINRRGPRPGCVIPGFFESLRFDLVSRKLVPLREDEGNRESKAGENVGTAPFLSFHDHETEKFIAADLYY